MSTRWHCLATGLPGDTCDATGTGPASAARHTNQTGHCTVERVVRA